MTQSAPEVNEQDVRRVLQRDYADADQDALWEAFRGLDVRERWRVVLACMKNAGGVVDALHRQLNYADTDDRDVLSEAEYPLATRKWSRIQSSPRTSARPSTTRTGASTRSGSSAHSPPAAGSALPSSWSLERTPCCVVVETSSPGMPADRARLSRGPWGGESIRAGFDLERQLGRCRGSVQVRPCPGSPPAAGGGGGWGASAPACGRPTST